MREKLPVSVTEWEDEQQKVLQIEGGDVFCYKMWIITIFFFRLIKPFFFNKENIMIQYILKKIVFVLAIYMHELNIFP